MRYINPESALSFLSLGQSVSIKSNVEESIRLVESMRDTYSLLIEVKHGIYSLSDVREEDGVVSFTVLEGEHFAAYYEAYNRDLVWDTSINAPDLKKSETRWRNLLCQGAIKKVIVDKMRDNVEKEPTLQDFGSDLFLYLLHCEREDDWYAPNTQVIKISGIAGE